MTFTTIRTKDNHGKQALLFFLFFFVVEHFCWSIDSLLNNLVKLRVQSVLSHFHLNFSCDSKDDFDQRITDLLTWIQGDQILSMSLKFLRQILVWISILFWQDKIRIRLITSENSGNSFKALYRDLYAKKDLMFLFDLQNVRKQKFFDWSFIHKVFWSWSSCE